MAIQYFSLNVSRWEEYSGSAKIVLGINSEYELLEIRDKAKNKNLPYYLVRDAGRTQIPSGSVTVCAIGPARVKEIDEVTGHLSLL
jgi:PTH2 family peptidyl-tRNA hydrolase